MAEKLVPFSRLNGFNYDNSSFWKKLVLVGRQWGVHRTSYWSVEEQRRTCVGKHLAVEDNQLVHIRNMRSQQMKPGAAWRNSIWSGPWARRSPWCGRFISCVWKSIVPWKVISRNLTNFLKKLKDVPPDTVQQLTRRVPNVCDCFGSKTEWRHYPELSQR